MFLGAAGACDLYPIFPTFNTHPKKICMKKTGLILLCLSVTVSFAQNNPITYPENPASVEQPGVPKGEVLKLSFSGSGIFPGTIRDIWIYVPAQYKADKPACVYVNQDALQWKAPTVFDNLIYQKEMPVTIGVFVSHGRVPSPDTKTAVDRFNRSYEFDGLGDNYARFLLEEVLPFVEKQKTSDGRPILLSKNGNDRAIGGSSTGGIASFTAAWERPDAFSRVFSAIGTFVGLRGGERYPTLIRKTEPKPIRIFLQDGSNDLNIYAGDWWKANESMERALRFSGYELNHVWGEDGHNGRHGTSIFPDVMRWLWKDWPRPVKAGHSQNQFLSELLIPGEEWELAGSGFSAASATAVNASGTFFFTDANASKTYQTDAAGKFILSNNPGENASGMAFGPEGKKYIVSEKSGKLTRYDAMDKAQPVSSHLPGKDIVVAHNGNCYVTAREDKEQVSRIYLVTPDGKKKLVDEGLQFANGIALTPDQTQLYVTESGSHWVWIYSIKNDGTLANKQKYGWLHIKDDDNNSGAGGLTCDTAGRVYVATSLGIQVMDQIGRVNAIIPLPGGANAISLGFAGPGFDVLYVAAGDKIYRRKLRTKAANSFADPVRPMNPRL
jgi:sugar lactone lactonase YvrE/enterochelin esterase-like enzyme